MQVVDQTRPWTGGFAALSSFGFGGSNVHLLMHRQANPNRVPRVISLRAEDASLTQDQGQQTDIGQLSENGLSGELIPLAARTSQGIEVLKDALKVKTSSFTVSRTAQLSHIHIVKISNSLQSLLELLS